MNNELITKEVFDRLFRDDQQSLNRSLFKVYTLCDELLKKIATLEKDLKQTQKEKSDLVIDVIYYKGFFDNFHDKAVIKNKSTKKVKSTVKRTVK